MCHFSGVFRWWLTAHHKASWMTLPWWVRSQKCEIWTAAVKVWLSIFKQLGCSLAVGIFWDLLQLVNLLLLFRSSMKKPKCLSWRCGGYLSTKPKLRRSDWRNKCSQTPPHPNHCYSVALTCQSKRKWLHTRQHWGFLITCTFAPVTQAMPTSHLTYRDHIHSPGSVIRICVNCAVFEGRAHRTIQSDQIFPHKHKLVNFEFICDGGSVV